MTTRASFDRSGRQVGTALRKHLIAGTTRHTAPRYFPASLSTTLEIDHRHGLGPFLTGGESREVLLTVADARLQARAYLCHDGQMVVEVDYRTEPAAPHHDEHHDTISIIAAVEHGYGGTLHPVRLTDHVQAFLVDVVCDELASREPSRRVHYDNKAHDIAKDERDLRCEDLDGEI